MIKHLECFRKNILNLSKALDKVLFKKITQEVHPVTWDSIISEMVKRQEKQQVLQERTHADGALYLFQVTLEMSGKFL